MPLIKDQVRQKNYKNYEPELQLKQDTSKQLFSDPKEIWDIQPICEGDNLTSENETEPEEIHLSNIRKKSSPKIQPAEIYFDKKLNKKNVTFEEADCICDGDFLEVSSLENEYSDYEEFIEHGRVICSNIEKERARPLTANPERFYRQVRRDILLEPHTCSHRPSTTPINLRSDYETELPCRVRRSTLKCRCKNGISYPRSEHLPQFYGDSYDCCCPVGESTKAHLPLKTVQLPEQKVKSRRQRDFVHQVFHTSVLQNPYLKEDRCYDDEGACEHACGKAKKILHNYEEMPAVDEQQEYFSDSTYKVPYSKMLKVVPPSFAKIPEKSESKGDTPAEWIFGPKKLISSDLNEKLINEVHPRKILKMRSRRTRMNKIKNGWKKAIVHTVREGSRNERVGLIVMGPKGPEFYSRASRKSQGYIPFRKTRSFPEGPTESYDPLINQECEKICASSSEPGARAFLKNEEPLPFEESKLEEKIAAFSKNVDEIVKTTEDKFLKKLVNDEGKDVDPLPPPSSTPSKPSTVNNDIFKKAEAEGLQADEKEHKSVEELLKMDYPPFHLLPFEALSPQVPKPLKIKDSSESNRGKSMAQNLNEQAKHYKPNQNEDKTKELEQKYPTRKKSKESIEANLSLWGMKPENGKESKDNAESGKNREEKSSKISKDEESQTGSVKSSEQININKQRRKKYFESTTSKTLSTYYSRLEDRSSAGDAKTKSTRNQFEENSETGSELKGKEERKSLSDAFQDLVNNGCAISEKESENLQNLFRQLESKHEIHEEASSSSTSSGKVRDNSPSSAENDVTRKAEDKENENSFEDKRKDEKRKYRNRFRKEGHAKGDWSDEYRKSQRKDSESCDVYPGNGKKISRLKDFKGSGDEVTGRKKSGRKSEGKIKKRFLTLEEKMKIIREALPSITAENEATHLKQLKKYIHRFIDRAEHRTSSSSETKMKNKKNIKNKLKDSSSTDSSEVKGEAKRIIDIVSNPFKKIASDMTINIAKTLTDALVQESSTKSPKNISISTKIHKDSENESEENSLPCCTTIGSDRYEETEPTYLRQLKKMRNDHLSNIVMEVKRLNEVLRFLDRWNRLKF